MGTADRSVHVYTLRVPEVLEGLQGLPSLTVNAEAPIADKHGILYQTLCVAAMGGGHPLTISQAAHRQLWKLPSSIAYNQGARAQISCASLRKSEISLKGERLAIRLMPGKASVTVYAKDSVQLGRT